MVIVECYSIAFVLLTLVLVMAVGVCDDFPWKWLNTLCKVILTGIVLFMLLSFLALLVGAALKGTL